MILKQYYLGCLAHASYLLGDEAASFRKCILAAQQGRIPLTSGAPATSPGGAGLPDRLRKSLGGN
jgi:hypothetical protein